MKYHIRQYRQSDRAELWELHLRAVLVEGFSLAVAKTDWDHDIDTVFINSGGEFLVAVIAEKIIGMGGLRRIGPTTGEVTRMRVDPQFQRMGIGSAILSKLEVSARQVGVSKICLDTANGKVRGFYESHSYQFLKKEGDGDFEYLFFEKHLS